MTERTMVALTRFSPCPDSTGEVLFEHWENADGSPALLLAASSPNGMHLQPGDVILRRVWAPAGVATLYDSAARTADHG